jgi:hypothetical protein
MIITQAKEFITNKKKNEHNTDQLELIGEEICYKYDIARKEEECLFCCGYQLNSKLPSSSSLSSWRLSNLNITFSHIYVVNGIRNF